MSSQKMKAAQYVEASADASSLNLVEVDIPSPVSGSVVVKVRDSNKIVLFAFNCIPCLVQSLARQQSGNSCVRCHLHKF